MLSKPLWQAAESLAGSNLLKKQQQKKLYVIEFKAAWLKCL